VDVRVTRVAVVTGAARGIGAATVTRLAAEGWAVVAVDRASDDPRLPYELGSAAELDAVVRGTGSDLVTATIADAADEQALGRLVAATERRHGGLDAFVAAAGVIAGGVPLWEMERAQLDAVLEGNLGGVIAGARAAIPALLRRAEPRSGRFIAIASAAASRGLPQLAAYCAAKAGIVGLVRALGLELRGSGVTANAVSPGSTRTPLLTQSARLYGLGSAEDFAGQQPIERLIDPQEVADLIAWIAGPGSGAITGAEMPIDGGLTL
jgi:SDR family mycofactocin-dependent oxidoreductase